MKKEAPRQEPRTPDEIQQRLRTHPTRVEKAPREAVESLRPYVDRVLAVVQDMFNIECVWVSDLSCLSDFFNGSRDRSQDQQLYDQIGAKLGIPLDCGNEDDHSIVGVALKLKQREQSPN